MGSCMSSESRSNSKMELSDINSNIYRVVNVDDNGVALWSGKLGITRTELTLYRKGKDPTRWPLKCLRRYGYDADLFSFEAGRRCTTGEGIYAFRCRRAESLFQTMQNYIQLSTIADDAAGSLLANATTTTTTIGTASPNGTSLIANNMAGNYILPNSRSTNANAMRMSLNNEDSHSNFDALILPATTDANYLEPITATMVNRTLACFHSIGDGSSSMGGPLSPGSMNDPHSPGSPNSINNILEVTTFNPLPTSRSNNNGVSNIYQDIPLRADIGNNRENSTKKLSLDIPPQEFAPSANFSTTESLAFRSAQVTPSFANNRNGNPTINDETLPFSQPISPTQSANDNNFDAVPTYMNVTPGEMSSSASTPKFPVTGEFKQTQTFRNSINNNNYLVDSGHCYENLEPNEIRPMLLRNQPRRISRTDVVTKYEPIVSSPTNVSDKNSEPSTPTDRKVNYIVLDLDQSHSQSNAINSNSTPSIAASINDMPQVTSPKTSPTKNANISSVIGKASNNSTFSSSTAHSSVVNSATTHSVMSLLPPESPKKGIFDYATIDFNKTVALSNSIAPTMDCEASRKTRHSSTAVPNITSSVVIAGVAGNSNAPPSHSSSISD